jgi:hypothetical protein
MDPAGAATNALQETDEYIFLDPRAPRQPATANAQTKPKRMSYGEAIVFVTGGAGYVEYGNIMAWANKVGKKVTYGGTEIIDPKRFVHILQSLGETQ